jgi:hypothetical protein
MAVRRLVGIIVGLYRIVPMRSCAFVIVRSDGIVIINMGGCPFIVVIFCSSGIVVMRGNIYFAFVVIFFFLDRFIDFALFENRSGGGR